VEAAWAAARSKETYLAALYSRLLSRKGEKRALVAVAHSMLVAAYQMLKTAQPYRDPGADFFDRLRPQRTVNRLVKRLAALGYKVDLTPLEGVQVADTQ
jgi:transposase